MTRERLQQLLQRVRAGGVEIDDAVEELRQLPFERLAEARQPGDMAVVDHHREVRAGVPEVVLGQWKTAAQIAAILRALADGGRGALATRVSADKAAAVRQELPAARYEALAQALVVPAEEAVVRPGLVAVVAAGTSDLPVAEEAALTAAFLGHRVERHVDVGVAGLHRVVAVTERLRAAEVAVVVAGMEGALPSVVAGLIEAPVIAVPTSVGYGVGLGGLAALLGMLSSCSAGVTVVNIDNGFGAAVAASLIARKVSQ